MSDLTGKRVRVLGAYDEETGTATAGMSGVVLGPVPDDAHGDVFVMFDGDTERCRVPADACEVLADA